MARIAFYDGFSYTDEKGSLIKGARKIQALPLHSCIPILLPSIPPSKDALLAACIRTKKLDATKPYSLCSIQLFDGQGLVLCALQKTLKYPSLPAILLPLGCEDSSLLDNALFCLESSLSVFYQQKLVYFSDYKDFADIFSAMEKMRDEYGFEVEKIYCKEHYDSIADLRQDFSAFGGAPSAYLALNCFRHHPELFLKPNPSFFKSSLFYIGLFWLFLCIALMLAYLFLDAHITRLENAKKHYPKSLDTKKPSFSHLSLLNHSLSLASKNHILFQEFSFNKEGSESILTTYACFYKQIDFINFAAAMEEWLHTPTIYEDPQDYGKMQCTWASWQK